MELREQIIQYLSRTGEKKKALAQRAGVDPGTITRIVQGIQTNNTLDTVKKIQRAMGG